MKIVSIVGARPQFIKAAPVSRALAASAVHEVLIHTGQHYDDRMSQVFFTELAIPCPAYNLGVGSASHGAQTGRMLESIESVLLQEKPDCVLIYGDTNSTIAGALAAGKLKIPLAHVEAGLRSFDRTMPEEMNRVVADHLSDMLLVPTKTAVKNLRREGIPLVRIHLVGDVMYDEALYHNTAKQTVTDLLRLFHCEEKLFILATIHRAENTESRDRLIAIMLALGEISSECPVLMPIHPRTRRALIDAGFSFSLPSRVTIVEPIGYLEMMALERAARLIVTDSGGVQKEAFFHRTPCVTLRDTTEWSELIDIGWNRLVPPTDVFSIVASLHDALLSTPCSDARLYGDGHAAERVVEVLLQYGKASAEDNALAPSIGSHACA